MSDKYVSISKEKYKYFKLKSLNLASKFISLHNFYLKNS